MFLTEYKLVGNWWSWESLDEYRKFIDISLGNCLVWWQEFLQRVRSDADSLAGIVAAVDALADLIECVLYIKEDKIISHVPPFLFLIHARGCLLWLLLPCLWSWQLCLAGHSMSCKCNCSGRVTTTQRQRRVWWPCSLQWALPVQQNESKQLKSQLSFIYSR